VLDRKDRSLARSISAALADHFAASGRDFPWRRTKDPFHLAIAEILLQKTRAENVVETYEFLIRRYPRPTLLMKAPLRDLQRRIRHLGLFRKRSAHLRNLATAVARDGTEPLGDPARATGMPGIGVYGANAIASFGFGKRVGIVDCNSRRVIARAFGLTSTDICRIRELSAALAANAPDARACNYGLLDVGAQHCTSKPNCDGCPLARICRSSGTVHRNP
jgi:A/G-specific adenine glycosylase